MSIEGLFGGTPPTPAPDPNAAPEPAPMLDPSGQPVFNAEGQPIMQTPTPASVSNVPPEINSLDAMQFLVDNGSTAEGDAPKAIDVEGLLKPEALSKIASSIDFSSGVAPDLITKIQGGDLTALPELLQVVGQNAYTQSMSHASLLSNRVMDSKFDVQASTLPDTINNAITSKQTSAAIPGAGDPVVDMVVGNLSSSIKAKYPMATPDQVANMTRQAMAQLNATMNPAAPTPAQQREQDAMNWDDFEQGK